MGDALKILNGPVDCYIAAVDADEPEVGSLASTVANNPWGLVGDQLYEDVQMEFTEASESERIMHESLPVARFRTETDFTITINTKDMSVENLSIGFGAQPIDETPPALGQVGIRRINIERSSTRFNERALLVRGISPYDATKSADRMDWYFPRMTMDIGSITYTKTGIMVPLMFYAMKSSGGKVTSCSAWTAPAL